MQKLIVLLALLFSPALAYAQGFGSPNGVGFPSNGSGSGGGLTSPVGISDGGTGQTTKAPAFNALSPLTTQGDILYGGASGAGTRLGKGTALQILRMNSGATAPEWATPEWSPSLYQVDLRTPRGVNVDPGGSTFAPWGCATYTTAGTKTSLSDSTGSYVNTATAASPGSAGYAALSGNVVWRQAKPRIWFKFKTPTALTDLRLQIGSTSTIGTMQAADASTAISAVNLRFSSTAGDTNFQLVTSNGSAATVTDTTVAAAADTAYTVCLDMSDTTKIDVYINGVYKCTTSSTMPATSTVMYFLFGVVTPAGAATSIRVGPMVMTNN